MRPRSASRAATRSSCAAAKRRPIPAGPSSICSSKSLVEVRTAGRRRAIGQHDRSRRGGAFPATARVHRRRHSARRRGPDSPRGRRSANAGHQAFRRQLPRLRRSPRPTWTWPSGSRSTPSASGWAFATRPNRCWCIATWPTSSCRASARALQATGIELRGDRATRELIPDSEAGDGRGLLHRISGADHLGERGRLARRGDRAHQPLRLASYRCDRDERLDAAREFTAGSIARR